MNPWILLLLIGAALGLLVWALRKVKNDRDAGVQIDQQDPDQPDQERQSSGGGPSNRPR
jgi:hypothetical protein